MVVLLLRESARAPTPLIDARARASFTRARELHASPRAQFQWLRIGDTGNFHKRDSYVSEHTNISLISTLLFTVAVSGMFMAPEWTDWASIDDEDSWRLKHLHEAYGFFWCFATFCELSASFISLIFLIGSNEINTEVQFEHFQLASGIALRLPFVLSFAAYDVLHVALLYYKVHLVEGARYARLAAAAATLKASADACAAAALETDGAPQVYDAAWDSVALPDDRGP